MTTGLLVLKKEASLRVRTVLMNCTAVKIIVVRLCEEKQFKSLPEAKCFLNHLVMIGWEPLVAVCLIRVRFRKLIDLSDSIL